jgi:hypothetical protein
MADEQLIERLDTLIAITRALYLETRRINTKINMSKIERIARMMTPKLIMYERKDLKKMSNISNIVDGKIIIDFD